MSIDLHSCGRQHSCLLTGYGFYRPHVQMMDPGWLAGRTQRGPEDQGTKDGGNDPVGVVKRCALFWLVNNFE